MKSVLSLFLTVVSMIGLLLLFFTGVSSQSQLHHLQLKDEPFQRLSWTKNQTLNEGLPSSIKVYTSYSSITKGVPQFSVYAIIDLSDPSLVFSIEEPPTKGVAWTPSQYAENSEQTEYVVLNGGYFDVKTNESLNLVVIDGVIQSPNVINEGQTSHPVIGTFAYWENKSMESLWTYNPNSSFTWGYEEPSPDLNKVPNATYPSNGFSLDAYQAISAGPLLLKNRKYYDGNYEGFNSYIMDQRHPRSAVCKTSDNKLILFVGDGRSDISTGLFPNETAAILQQINCVDAINLDGGGSSCLLVNKQVANSPSDGKQRPVPNALVVKQAK